MNARQPSLFTGRILRDRGMAKAASSPEAQEWLRKARQCALEWLQTHPTVSTDDVVSLVGHPHLYGLHANLIGSLFKGKQWEKAGDHHGKRPVRHAGHSYTYRRRNWEERRIDD